MTSSDLDIAFNNAVQSINEHTETYPADFLLRLYAYYKRATNSIDQPSSSNPLISAFKTNALFQAKNITPDEAKRLYIEAVKHYFLYRK
ncbi:acyl-CoA-binding protein [Ulvibacter antarcticus]|uniref:Acyl-CoA-binding protein n=1 Tax=Ulvibacter antarcticus TaxID=442714 RepID=A0A3L9YI74_9FLAO|nr:acyl-CoA-binding protein [Ulvibacter antarcticus]RMA57855.1 acyl-CoA-binding protein [Ulvibacter antarcticus]